MNLLRRLRDFIRGSGNRHKDADRPVKVDEINAARTRFGWPLVGVDPTRPGGNFTVRARRESVDRASDDHSFACKDPKRGLDPKKVSRGTVDPRYLAIMQLVYRYPPGFRPPINLNPQQHKRVSPCSPCPRATRTSAATIQARRRRKTAKRSAR